MGRPKSTPSLRPIPGRSSVGYPWVVSAREVAPFLVRISAELLAYVATGMTHAFRVPYRLILNNCRPTLTWPARDWAAHEPRVDESADPEGLRYIKVFRSPS